MLAAILVMALGAVILGAALGYASIKFRVEGDPLVDKIDAILPQTQCGQCGFPGCKPYATAIAKGQTPRRSSRSWTSRLRRELR
jgi:electron transport complex protein RnfB